MPNIVTVNRVYAWHRIPLERYSDVPRPLSKFCRNCLYMFIPEHLNIGISKSRDTELISFFMVFVTSERRIYKVILLKL